MEGTIPDENINPSGKHDAEVLHTENLHDEDLKTERTELTRAQIRRFGILQDVRVLPMLGVIYAVSILDRINIGSAKVLGMEEDLNLGDATRYSIILLLFFPSYALTDVPSNWILTKVSPRLWLAFLMFGWGAILCGMGFTHNWQVVAFLRFMLGAFEGGVLPGVTFVIACWYTKPELHKRIAAAYGVGLISSGFAGILSFGLGQLDGVHGMSGWRWIFSIEGGATMLLGAVAPLFLPSFPEKASWLKPAHREHLFEKLHRDHGHAEQEKVTLRTFRNVSTDWLFWLQGSVYCFNVGTANATAFFAPTIIAGLGYDGLQASLRSGFPFFAALGLLMITSTISDRFQRRATTCLFTITLMIIGLIIMRENAGFSREYSAAIYLCHGAVQELTLISTAGVRYTGIFFLTMGVHSTVPALLAFNQSNTLGAANRAISSGMLIACGAIGGIIGSLIFRGQDAPGYAPGIYTTIGFCVYNIFALLVCIFAYRKRNQRIAQGEVLEGAPEGYRFSL
ncbi:uncharacterized protein LTR77_004005 [Saxophila tyrrhenica]|uniref:Major facilitator superfamily (MFS) profile domain-containing protein n=1 Tax=Saxophila tyrrhenica TaxID=1690608 RepID=A0AAV9PIM7_9PEZI|nr:hypothetical protein LTR77_004005 [Saxophila tyrrhenica]